MNSQIRTGLLCAAVAFVAAWGLLPSGDGRHAAAQPAPAPAAAWEYNTVSIDPASMQAKLTELGADGWEVFSILNTDMALDQTDANRPHLLTQRVEITSRRPLKK